MNTIRGSLLVLFLVGFASSAEAQYGGGSRRAPVANAPAYNSSSLRSVPIVERPNRPFHVYGNSVRFVHKLRNGR